MKVVWLVLVAALLTPAATALGNCGPPSGSPLRYEIGGESEYVGEGTILELKATCTNEFISVSWRNDLELVDYRIEYVCQEDRLVLLAESEFDDLDSANLSWSEVNATSCRFFGAYIDHDNSRGDLSNFCQAIAPVTVDRSGCVFPIVTAEPPTSTLVLPSTTSAQGNLMSDTPEDSSPTIGTSPTLEATTPQPQQDNGGLAMYVPVLIVIFVFMVLIGAITAGIFLFKYKSQRSRLYRSHIYFVDDVDPDFNPVKIHSTITVSPSMETIFHGLEVEYCNQKSRVGEVETGKEHSSLVPSDLLIANLTDFEPTDKMAGKNHSIPAQNAKSKTQLQSPSSQKSGYISEQSIKADVESDSMTFDLSDETDPGLGHLLHAPSSDSKAPVAKPSSSGGYSHDGGSAVIQNTMPPGNKNMTRPSPPSASSGYVTEQTTKASMDFDSTLGSDFLTFDLGDDENQQPLQPTPYSSQSAPVMNIQGGLHLESSEGHPTSSKVSVIASSGYVTDTTNSSVYVAESTDIESSVHEVCITLDDTDLCPDMQSTVPSDNQRTVQNGGMNIPGSSNTNSGYVTEQSTTPNTDSDLGFDCLSIDIENDVVQLLQPASEPEAVINCDNSGYVYKECSEILPDGHCSIHDESPEGPYSSSGVSFTASSGYGTDTASSSAYIVEPNTASLAPGVGLALGEDTSMEYEELDIETEPLSCSELWTVSGDYVPSPTSVSAATAHQQQSISSVCEASKTSAQDTRLQHQTLCGDYASESNPMLLNINRQVSTSDSDGYVHSSEMAESKTIPERQNLMSTSSGYVYADNDSANTTTATLFPSTSDGCSIPSFELEVSNDHSSYSQHHNVFNCVELQNHKDVNPPLQLESAADWTFDWDIESLSCSNSNYIPETQYTGSATLSSYVTSS